MRPPVSATLAVWASAWLAGRVGYDDVLDAVTAGTHSHVVVDLRRSESVRRGGSDAAPTHRGPAESAPDEPGVVRLGAVLIDWRAAGEPVRVCLPVPGDVRGVPATPDFLAAALEAGQAAYAGRLGLVPSRPRRFAEQRVVGDHLAGVHRRSRGPRSPADCPRPSTTWPWPCGKQRRCCAIATSPAAAAPTRASWNGSGARATGCICPPGSRPRPPRCWPRRNVCRPWSTWPGRTSTAAPSTGSASTPARPHYATWPARCGGPAWPGTTPKPRS